MGVAGRCVVWGVPGGVRSRIWVGGVVLGCRWLGMFLVGCGLGCYR